MTEKTFLWEGVITGDSVYAPYNAEELNAFLTLPQNINDDGFVVPGYLNDLKVEGDLGVISSSVYVKPGAALIKGFTYINTEVVSLSIEPISFDGRYRHDSVILRINYDDKTIRLAVLKGTELVSASAILYTKPTLTQVEGYIWEVEIAHVFVDYHTPFYITNEFVYDSRKFIFTNEHSAIATKNLVRNGEFMGFSGAQTVGNDQPDLWDYYADTAITASAALSPMTRGRSITLPSGGSLRQYVYIKGRKTFTLKFLYKNTSSVNFYIWPYKTDGTYSADYLVRYIRPSIGLVEDVWYQETITFEDEDIDYLMIQFIGGISSCIIGQVILVEGYHPGPFRPFSEFIPFRSSLTDASWNATAKSDGTTTIDLTASFGGHVLPGTKAVTIMTIARDSGTGATAVVTLSFSSVLSAVVCGILDIGSVTNDVFRSNQVTVPVNTDLFVSSLNTPRFDVTVDATGVLTMDVFLYITGIYV